jgi:CRP-like cAMP-binding protein
MQSNQILSALSRSSRDKLMRHGDEIELHLGETMSLIGHVMRYVYFPLAGFISEVAQVSEGGRLEVGLIGTEGMLGASIVLGVPMPPHHAMVQGAGSAIRIGIDEIARQCTARGELARELNRYVFVQLQQLALTAVCTRFHVVEARLARWFLMARDRAHSDQFYLTHEYLALMLGVRRVGVTQAASALQSRGLLAYSRGNVSVLNVAGLTAASCSCYQRSNDMYAQLLGSGRHIVSAAKRAK